MGSVDNTTNDIITDVTNTATNAAAGDIGAYISMAIYIILGIAILGGIIFGLKRGFGKTVVRLITIILSLVVAYIIASSLSGWIASFFVGQTLDEVVLSFIQWIQGFAPNVTVEIPQNIQDVLAYFDAETAQHLLSLIICLFITPVLFAIVFYILKLLTLIIYWLITLMCGMVGTKRGFFSAIGGALVGVVQGFVISLALLIPLAGFTQLATEARAAVQESDVPDYTKEQVEEVFTTYLDSTLNNPMLKMIGSFGGDAMFTGLTTATINDYKVDMGEEAKELFLIYVDGIPLADIDMYHPTPWREHLIRFTTDIGTKHFTATTLSGLLRSFANAVKGGALVIPAEEPYKTLIYDMISTFETSDMTNLEGDLETLVNIYIIMGEHDLLIELSEGTSDGLLDKMVTKTDSGDMVIDLIIDELEKNERTYCMLDSFAKLSITALSQSVGLGDDSSELYQNVKDGMVEVLQTKKDDYATDEEYKEALHENLDNTLQDNGISLDDETLEAMTDFIAENFSDKDEITDKDVTDAILSYYSAYLEGQNGEDLEGIEGIEGIEGVEDLEDLLGNVGNEG